MVGPTNSLRDCKHPQFVPPYSPDLNPIEWRSVSSRHCCARPPREPETHFGTQSPTSSPLSHVKRMRKLPRSRRVCFVLSGKCSRHRSGRLLNQAPFHSSQDRYGESCAYHGCDRAGRRVSRRASLAEGLHRSRPAAAFVVVQQRTDRAPVPRSSFGGRPFLSALRRSHRCHQPDPADSTDPAR